MTKFESIRVQGFRRLVDVTLQLRPLTVIIGPNGCGKTSLLEAWWLLAKSAEGKLREEAEFLGGLHQLLTKPGPNVSSHRKLGFDVRLSHEGDQFDYSMRVIGPPYVFEEHLLKTISDTEPLELLPKTWLSSSTSRIQETKLYDSRHDHDPSLNSEIELFRQKLASCELFRPIEIASVRNWQTSSSVEKARLSSEVLFSYLNSVKDKDPDRFEIICDTLRAAFPYFERLEIKEVIPGRLAMSWKESKFDEPMYMTQLSEGTLRFLWLVALLLSHELPVVTLIDEPELSLHPQLLMILVDLMRESSLRTQLIVATQSDQLVRFLKPEEVLVADIEEGAAKFTWGDDLDLDHWLKDFTLDQLWTMGVLGGRS